MYGVDQLSCSTMLWSSMQDHEWRHALMVRIHLSRVDGCGLHHTHTACGINRRSPRVGLHNALIVCDKAAAASLPSPVAMPSPQAAAARARSHSADGARFTVPGPAPLLPCITVAALLLAGGCCPMADVGGTGMASAADYPCIGPCPGYPLPARRLGYPLLGGPAADVLLELFGDNLCAFTRVRGRWLERAPLKFVWGRERGEKGAEFCSRVLPLADNSERLRYIPGKNQSRLLSLSLFLTRCTVRISRLHISTTARVCPFVCSLAFPLAHPQDSWPTIQALAQHYKALNASLEIRVHWSGSAAHVTSYLSSPHLLGHLVVCARTLLLRSPC